MGSTNSYHPYSGPLSLRFANLVFRLWSSMITQTVKQVFLLVLIVLWQRSEGAKRVVGLEETEGLGGYDYRESNHHGGLAGVSFFEVDLAYAVAMADLAVVVTNGWI
uniref:Uncharacterized protein n=1 Tax=Fagus sylvatica TaxID=28930 RepID=A0A2N9J6B4_FAGSY